MKSLAVAYAMKRKGKGMSHGGEMRQMDDMDHDDVVDSIMRERYSEGGRVANGGDDDWENLADFKPNEFDDLALRDGLESDNSGDADGDFLGDTREDEDRHDIVAQIMRSRSKRDRMPRPA